jgi:hypothetical protein
MAALAIWQAESNPSLWQVVFMDFSGGQERISYPGNASAWLAHGLRGNTFN